MSIQTKLHPLDLAKDVDRTESPVCVVIPCYRVKSQILDVIASIGPEVDRVLVIDDQCPDNSGQHVILHCKDPRVTVHRNERNLGVGGAVKTGYFKAIEMGAAVVVKLDGDGQMDTKYLADLISPILQGDADYTKGNRFEDLGALRRMPRLRLLGNTALSFITKASTGYWNIFDPTNGYTAIAGSVLRKLPLAKINNRYFFESDMLFRLNLVRAVVGDVPMPAIYNNEQSSLHVRRVFWGFSVFHVRNIFKRIVYNYYLKDMSVASFELPLGLAMLTWGVAFGLYHWILSGETGRVATAGTVMLSALPTMLGIQFLLAFISGDIRSSPNAVRIRRVDRGN